VEARIPRDWPRRSSGFFGHWVLGILWSLGIWALGILTEVVMDTHLANRVVLVTGASGGIGGDVVRAFVREGARVVAHFGRQRGRAEALAAELGSNGWPLAADLTVEADVDRLFQEAEARLGPIEILVANAGSWPPDDIPLTRMTVAQWNGTLAANLT